MLIKNIEIDGLKFKIRSLTWEEQKSIAKTALEYALIKPVIDVDSLSAKTLFDLFFEIIALTDDDLKQKLQNMIKEWFI